MTFTTLLAAATTTAETPMFHYQGSINYIAIISAILIGASVGLLINAVSGEGAGTIAAPLIAGATAFLALTLFGGATTNANEEALTAWLNQHYAELNLTPQVDALHDLETVVSPENGKTYQFVKSGHDMYTLVELNSVPAE